MSKQLRIILPKVYVPDIKEKIIFLAGPIKGAPKWQDKAIRIIHSQNPQIYLASPSKHLREEYLQSALKGDETKFPRQLNWERYYLELTSERGSIMFWLPKEESHFYDRAYARDTRGELGEWRGRLVYNSNIRLAIGGEELFDGLDVIKRNFTSLFPKMKFFSTLEETCAEAVRL